MNRPIDPDILARNLDALEGSSADAARRIRAARPRTDIEFIETDEGLLAATLDGRALASKRRPRTEAQRLADTVDLKANGGVVVLGFGLGHHVAAIAERMGRSGVVIAFEPDVGLLRAVLERIDCSGWFTQTNFALLTDAEDSAAITQTITGVEGVLALGVTMLEHPASRARCGAVLDRFGEQFADVMKSVRSTIVTTLVQSETTLRNLLMNVEHYALGPGIADLKGACADRPAIVVSAGPSLERNVRLLARPGVRDRFVIIAVQTTLKTLLGHGIRPHFVTALDYHEISTRFYEGLSAHDVEGVTLIAEPHANPAIFDAFPGPIRTPGSEQLDLLLGALGRGGNEADTIEQGATVAHLAYHVARHLGCDPVILIGQDLAFTDGQYYSAGAAIHHTWSNELNAFNSLEMLEWQRIVRHRRLLHRVQDTLGRHVYADEQMSSYRLLFEKQFRSDTSAGLRVIDATEGGVRKQHTEVMTLADAIDRFGADAPISLPSPDEPRGDRTELIRLVAGVRSDVKRVAKMSRQAIKLLTDMRDHHDDQQRVNALIDKVNRVRDRVTALAPAWEMVNQLNQTGTLNRFRADRSMHLDGSGDQLEQQRRQIERDIQNVTWLGDAADQLDTLLGQCAECLNGAPKMTRDAAVPAQLIEQIDSHAQSTDPRAALVIPVDSARSGFGTPRDLAEPIHDGCNALQLTLARASRARSINRIILIAEHASVVRALAGDSFDESTMSIVETGSSIFGGRTRAVAVARSVAPECWRGAISNMSVFDEVCDPKLIAEVMKRERFDIVVPIGADWALVDPRTIDDVIDRLIGSPGGGSIAFMHGAPGLAVCALRASVIAELAAQLETAGPFASVGGLLGYIPALPQADPIGRNTCVQPDPVVRDLAFRCIADSPDSISVIRRVLADVDPVTAGATEVAQRISSICHEHRSTAPRRVTLELCTGRRTSGLRGEWLRGAGDLIERTPIEIEHVERIITSLAEARPDVVLTFAGVGDPLLHPDCARFIAHATRCGIAAVHVRTDLLEELDTIRAVVDAGVDIISVDLLATSPETYRDLMGVDRFEHASRALEAVLAMRRERPIEGGIALPWIVPRITRCDRVYDELEAFYDRWLMTAGACVIDPLPAAIDGRRITPLPVPMIAADRFVRNEMTVLCDGSVVRAGDWSGQNPVGNLIDQPLDQVWAELVAQQTHAEAVPA